MKNVDVLMLPFQLLPHSPENIPWNPLFMEDRFWQGYESAIKLQFAHTIARILGLILLLWEWMEEEDISSWRNRKMSFWAFQNQAFLFDWWMGCCLQPGHVFPFQPVQELLGSDPQETKCLSNLCKAAGLSWAHWRGCWSRMVISTQ